MYRLQTAVVRVLVPRKQTTKQNENVRVKRETWCAPPTASVELPKILAKIG